MIYSQTSSFAVIRFKMSLAFKYSNVLSYMYPFTLNFRASYSANRDSLKTILGINQNEANFLLMKNEKLATLPAQKIVATIDTLQEHGLDGRKIIRRYPSLCFSSKFKIVRDILISKECGIDIRRRPEDVLINILQLQAKSPVYLKRYNWIDEKFDVLESFKAVLHLPSEAIPWFPRQFSQEDTLKDIREAFMVRYLQHEYSWLPSIPHEFITKHSRRFFIPLEQLRGTVHLLNTEFGVTPNWVLKHNSVLALPKDDMQALVKQAEKLGISNFKESAITNPRLLWLKPQRLKSILHVLSSHGAPVEVLIVSPHLLLNKPSTVDAKIRSVGLVPYLDALRTNKRFGDVISRINKARKNIGAVDSSNSSGTTVGTLVGPQRHFDRYLQDNVRRNHDVFNYLISVFPQYDRRQIRKQIMQHPQYLASDLLSVVEILSYLRSQGFDSESVFAALPILFYPKTVVQQAYDFVLTEEQPKEFVEFDNAQKLHLLLYTIEKPYHYSGDGIFSDELVRTKSFHESLHNEAAEEDFRII